MMDKAYILEQGILEQYVLGELSPEQQQQLEEIVNNDASLKAQLTQLEANLEKLSFENAIDPPPKVKAELFEKIRATETKIVSLTAHNTFKKYFYAVSGIAACLLVAGMWMYAQLNDAQQELRVAEEQRKQLNEAIEQVQLDLASANGYVEIIRSPETQQYILRGNQLAPNAKVVSYVNHQKKSVVVNTQELPELDANHDYQMWADVEGVMIDMGVINRDAELLAMNYIDNAESLNITIEPAGGNDHPTVSQLVTNVYLR